MGVEARPLRLTVGERIGEVSALLVRPPVADSMLVLGHGAGAGMRHRFMEEITARLADRKMATFRYQFPYMEAGRRRPDAPGILIATIRAAVSAAASELPGLPLLAGGKSMGGRMTSQAAVNGGLPGVQSLVYFGFPLHRPGRPSSDRAAHLADVDLPMLFLQGTRDALADLDLLGPVCAGLGSRVALHVVDGADHSFHVLKRSGRTDDEAMDELADTTAEWAAGL